MALSHKQKLFLSSKLCSPYFNFKYLLLEVLQLTMNTKLKHIPEIVAIVILSMFCYFLSQTRNWRNLLRSFNFFCRSKQCFIQCWDLYFLWLSQRIRDNSSHYSSVTTVRRSSFILFYVLYPRRIFINDDTCLYRLWHQINLQALSTIEFILVSYTMRH